MPLQLPEIVVERDPDRARLDAQCEEVRREEQWKERLALTVMAAFILIPLLAWVWQCR